MPLSFLWLSQYLKIIVSHDFNILVIVSEDADKLRIHTLSEAGDMDSLEKMVDGSDSEDSSEGSTYAPWFSCEIVTFVGVFSLMAFLKRLILGMFLPVM